MARSLQVCICCSIRLLLIAISILVASIVTLPPALAQSELSPEAKTSLQEGIAAAKSQNWESARKYFEAALAAAPEAPEVLFNLGLLYDRKGGAELVASAWYRAFMAAAPATQNRAKIEERLIELHASAEARSAKFMAIALEAAKQSVPTYVSRIPVLRETWGSDLDCGSFSSPLDPLISYLVGIDQLESVHEAISWLQGHECQGYFQYLAVAAVLVSEQPQQAARYIEKISGRWKVHALISFAAVKWKKGDKAGAIELVEKAEATASQVLKRLGKSTPDVWRLRSDVAFAWGRVENVPRARRAIEKMVALGTPTNAYRYFGNLLSAVEAVVVTLLLAEKDIQAKKAVRAIISKLDFSGLQETEKTYKNLFDDLSSKSREELIALRNKHLDPYYPQASIINRELAGGKWSSDRLSVELALQSGMTQKNYWIGMASNEWSPLYGEVYRDGGKFLTSASSGSDAEDTIAILSGGSAALLVGSRKMKELDEMWRNKSADPGE